MQFNWRQAQFSEAGALSVLWYVSCRWLCVRVTRGIQKSTFHEFIEFFYGCRECRRIFCASAMGVLAFMTLASAVFMSFVSTY